MDLSSLDRATALDGWPSCLSFNEIEDELIKRAGKLRKRGVKQRDGEDMLLEAVGRFPNDIHPTAETFANICNWRWTEEDNGEEPEKKEDNSIYHIPGFVNSVMQHCLETAPYPNPALAFAGALALQAFLCARKVRDENGLQTSLYLIALAMSGSGKEWPRRLNVRILQEVGLAQHIGDNFASGEGIEDALAIHPNMIFQLDEMDGLLSAVKGDKDARFQGIMTSLLKIFTSAGSVIVGRKKAAVKGQANEPAIIQNPGMTLFGTAVPSMYYGSLNEKMLTNGFFSRSVIIEGSKRATGQDADMRDPSDTIIKIAKYWADFGGDGSVIGGKNPKPKEIKHNREARDILADLRKEMDQNYSDCEKNNDNIGATLWSRVHEQACKLALIYACSENHEAPSINKAAASWACRFAKGQAQKMLTQAMGRVSDSPFHALCQKIRARIGDSETRRSLIKSMHISSKQFDEAIDHLVEAHEIEIVNGTNGRSYKAKK